MIRMTTPEIADAVTDTQIDDSRTVFLASATIVETISERVAIHFRRTVGAAEVPVLAGHLDEAARLLHALGHGGDNLPDHVLDPRITAIETVTSRILTTAFVFSQMHELTEYLAVGLRRHLDGYTDMWTIEERRAIDETLEHAAWLFNVLAEAA